MPRMARLVFIVFCLFPTLGVAGWAWYRRSSAHAQHWQADLAYWLRMDVKLQGVEHPRPGVVRLRGIRLSDAETGAEIVRAGIIEVRRSNDLLELELAQPEVSLPQTVRLAAWFAELLMQQPARMPKTLTLRAAGLTLKGPELTYVARQVAGGMRHTPSASVFELAFVNPEPGATPARLKVVRDRRGEPGYSIFFSTGDAGLPCALVSPQASDWLGSDARMRCSGNLWQSEQGWSGQVAGELQNVDLHRLVSDRLPHQLTGKAQLEFEELVIEEGRIARAAGALYIGRGMISRSLLAAGGQALGLVPSADALPPPNHPLVAFARMACSFTIGPEGLVFSGKASDALPGAILVDTYGALWAEPALQPQPVAALVRMLAPGGEAQVPATRQAELLLRWLPLQEIPASQSASQ